MKPRIFHEILNISQPGQAHSSKKVVTKAAEKSPLLRVLIRNIFQNFLNAEITSLCWRSIHRLATVPFDDKSGLIRSLYAPISVPNY